MKIAHGETVSRRKVSVALAALLALAGVVVDVSPAEADTPNTVRIKHETGGLGGYISWSNQRSAGRYFALYEGSEIEGNEYSDKVPQYIKAGAGYCVWEELFKANTLNVNTRQGYTKIGNFNHGKDSRETSTYMLESYRQVGWDDYARFSKLRIYSC